MPKSIYEEIFQDLKDKIETRKYQYGTLLPSENELTKTYHCSRNTLRRAVAKLTAIGYTQPIHGKGVHIIYNQTRFPQSFFDFNSIKGLGQAAREHGFTVTNKILNFTELTVNKQLSEKSGFEENTDVYFIQRLRSVDGIAKMIDTTLLCKKQFPDLAPESLSDSLFDYIEKEAGMTIQTVKRCVTMERTTPLDEKYLCLDGYNCLAVITSYVYNSEGIQFEYTESRNRPDLFAFSTVVSKNS